MAALQKRHRCRPPSEMCASAHAPVADAARSWHRCYGTPLDHTIAFGVSNTGNTPAYVESIGLTLDVPAGWSLDNQPVDNARPSRYVWKVASQALVGSRILGRYSKMSNLKTEIGSQCDQRDEQVFRQAKSPNAERQTAVSMLVPTRRQIS
jgi:hypothetical protein